MLFQGILAFVTLFCCKNAPYGRYNDAGGIKPKLAWILMESPSLVLTIINFIRADKTLIPVTNYVLLSMYFAHYTNRAIIYPFRIS